MTLVVHKLNYLFFSRDSGSSSLRLADVFAVIVDVLVLVVRFHAEIIYSLINLFIAKERKDISGETVLVRDHLNLLVKA